MINGWLNTEFVQFDPTKLGIFYNQVWSVDISKREVGATLT